MVGIGSRAISAFVAGIIIVGVALAIAIAVVAWQLGILGALGFGSRPVRLGVYGGMEAMGSPEASQFKILVKNLCGETLYIDRILVDSKYVATVFLAETPDGKSRLVREDNRVLVKLGPGESVYIWAVVKGPNLAAGTTHRITIQLTTGQEFYYDVNVEYVSMKLKGYGAYNLGVKRGDGLIAGVLKAKIRNTRGKDFVDGKVEIYVLGQDKPIRIEDIPEKYRVLKAGEEKDVLIYFGIPEQYRDEILIVKLVYVTKDNEKEEFAFLVQPPKPIKVYILYIEGTPGSWISPSTLYQVAREVVYPENVEMVDSIEKLVEFFRNADKHKRAIILSAYGESLPAPDKEHDFLGIYEEYRWKGEPYVHDPDTSIYIPINWKKWFEYVRNKIAENEMIYVNVIGIFGWYLVTKPDNVDPYYSHYDWRPSVTNPGESCCGGNGRFHKCVNPDLCPYDFSIERNGLKVFMDDDDVTYTTTPIHGCAYPVEEVIRDVEAMFAWDFPEKVYDVGEKWASWRSLNKAAGKHLFIWFYTTEHLDSEFPYAAAAYKIGRGFLVHNGFPPITVLRTEGPQIDPEEFIARAAIYFALYTYVKAFILGS